MRFGVVHRVMTDTLAVLGLLALLTSGELDRTVSYVVLVAMALALALPERFQDRPTFRKAAVAAPLVLLGVQVLRLASGESLLAASIEFAAGLQVLRLATRRGSRFTFGALPSIATTAGRGRARTTTRFPPTRSART